MKKKYDFLINIGFIILISALVFVMLNYYTSVSTTPSNSELNIGKDYNRSQEKVSEKVIIKNETQNNVFELSGDDEYTDSGETLVNSIGGRKEEKDDVVIITSENDISSKEKKVVLTELDQALMELLEVVDSVQVIDETRLILDDSEVQ